MGYFVGLRLAAHDFFFVVQKGAENAESAPFWIRHRPPRGFQHFRPVQKGAEKAESAPFWRRAVWIAEIGRTRDWVPMDFYGIS